MKHQLNEGSRARERARMYFERPAWQRVLQVVWNKYTSLGRIGGNAEVKRLSEAEAEALNSFFGWNYKVGDTATIPLILFDEELQSSGFSPMNLLRLHTLLEGIPLLTREEQRILEEERWHELFRSVRISAEQPLCYEADHWLTRLEQGLGVGGRTLHELYKTDSELAVSSVEVVVRALNVLFPPEENGERQSIRLPVLAAQVSGDAHALDMSQPAGRMLAAVLREKITGIEDASEPIPALEDGSESLKLRETYRSFGILDDDLSTIVHWYVPQQGQPVLPNVWTLRQVEAAGQFPRCSNIYVVENPAVFSTLLDSIPASHVFSGNPPALICTSGPASAAAIRWMERCLADSGDLCSIVYSGDFDIKGLTMGQTLADRFSDRFIPWRFDCETYIVSTNKRKGPPLDESEQTRLKKMNVSWDERLCSTMALTGYKVHQEMFVELLANDFWFSGSVTKENDLLLRPVSKSKESNEDLRSHLKHLLSQITPDTARHDEIDVGIEGDEQI